MFVYRYIKNLSLTLRSTDVTTFAIKQEQIHASVKGGMKYNTGRLLMVLHKPLIPHKGEEYDDGRGYEEPEMDGQGMLPMP